MCYRILLADNIPNFVDTRADYLQLAGFEVVKAVTLAETRHILVENRIHLAILDNRLVDDNDENDYSGIQLARETIDDGIPKIILTGYPTVDSVRQSLGPLLDGLAPAVDFICKNDGPDAMMEAVQKALRSRNRINWNLDIRFEEMEHLSLPGLVGLLQSDIQLRYLQDRVGEFKDLLRKLFEKEDQITIMKLLWRYEGHLLLQVSAYGPGAQGQFLVTCGLRPKIRQELANFDQYIPKNPKTGIIAVQRRAETTHYGGFIIQVPPAPDDESEEFETLFDYYQNHSEKQARSSLEELLESTLHSSLRLREPAPAGVSIHGWYTAQEKTTIDWPRILEHISMESQRMGLPQARCGEEGLLFRFSNGRILTLPDPYPLYVDGLWEPAEEIPFGLIPGGMNVHSIVVDSSGKCRLTDYCQAGVAPVWHIFASLENSLRFSLPCGSSFLDMYDYESQLEKSRGLGGAASTEDFNPDLRKLAASIQVVRSQAASYTGNQIEPYLACLFYLSMKELVELDTAHRLMPSQVMPLLFRLLTAGCISERLSRQPAQTRQARDDGYPELLIDDDSHTVLLGDRDIALTQREFELLLYLAEHPNKVCEREDILRAVFGVTEASKTENDLLNTNLARLREKIEPDNDKPVYIITVRGVGIRLIPKP